MGFLDCYLLSVPKNELEMLTVSQLERQLCNSRSRHSETGTAVAGQQTSGGQS